MKHLLFNYGRAAFAESLTKTELPKIFFTYKPFETMRGMTFNDNVFFRVANRYKSWRFPLEDNYSYVKDRGLGLKNIAYLSSDLQMKITDVDVYA